MVVLFIIMVPITIIVIAIIWLDDSLNKQQDKELKEVFNVKTKTKKKGSLLACYLLQENFLSRLNFKISFSLLKTFFFIYTMF